MIIKNIKVQCAKVKKKMNPKHPELTTAVWQFLRDNKTNKQNTYLSHKWQCDKSLLLK